MSGWARLLTGVTAIAVAGAVVAGCSGDDEPKPSSASTTAANRPAAVSTTVVTLPAGIAKSDQLCAQISALAAKFSAAPPPQQPADLVPFARDLAAFFQQAAGVAPRELVTDFQKLDEFYGRLADQVAAGEQPNLRLGDAPAASSRFRQYSKTICGVDDKVFTL